MAHLPPQARDVLGADLCSVLRASATAGNPRRGVSRKNKWDLWVAFCSAYGVDDPCLPGVLDKLPLLMCFALQYRDGRLAPQGAAVKSRTAEDAVRLVGQTFTQLGLPDPRFNCHGRMDSRLTNLWKDWNSHDDPPRRLKPVPIQVLHAAQRIADTAGSLALATTARMMWIGFFFLCRPGEYCETGYSSHLFRLCDVQLYLGAALLDLFTASPALLRSSSFTSMTFSDQKNSIRGEKVGLAHSGHPIASPTAAIANQVIHLVANKASPSTPLCAFCQSGTWFYVTPSMVTDLLREAVAIVGPSCGIAPEDISARSLRASGAMALLCSNCDPVRIRLLGRWRSDEMLKYLHIQAPTLVQDLSQRMLHGGNYSFLPNTVPYELHSTQPPNLYWG